MEEIVSQRTAQCDKIEVGLKNKREKKLTTRISGEMDCNGMNKILKTIDNISSAI